MRRLIAAALLGSALIFGATACGTTAPTRPAPAVQTPAPQVQKYEVDVTTTCKGTKVKPTITSGDRLVKIKWESADKDYQIEGPKGAVFTVRHTCGSKSHNKDYTITGLAGEQKIDITL